MKQIAGIFILILLFGITILAAGLIITVSVKKEEKVMNEQIEREDANNFKITVVFDNFPYKEGLESSWGFSALVNTPGGDILFDTGGDGNMLLSNMQKLQIVPGSIDIIVLSHIHGDHTGGLFAFLKQNSDVNVFVPRAFGDKFKNKVTESGAEITEVEESRQICENVYSTGQLGLLIKEQGLVLKTDKGLILITGAHPGIVKMLKVAKDIFKEDILLAMGGFHLEWSTKGKIQKVISSFKELGVRFAGPCHCTGEKARAIFKKEYEEHFIELGVGRIITMDDLDN